MTDYIINEKGEEVISDRHQKDFKKEDHNTDKSITKSDEDNSTDFTDVNFEDI
jgi:hypothetical protein